ncbi:MAG: chromosome segregation protein SMC [Leptotrichiaceae bacterium]|nr:chromosome segregation protein SMC [Leptotrichiaceae bacterium]MBP6281105.1 chromosome segregation protein SMC [Leptotrichiaceae bacterium]MBP7101239.1 chromosome segregation protein SMC [Leptotrichiaceae bacterium]MBP7739284.1 chromosome segregation protein SMC [Leptotrichiaceae bacterium]
MHLKALELSGFKSFADKTTVEFNRGITSIVGPNGSGKSNILDAILWVLGEQSYKNIRAKESSDVIFSGGKNKKPKSMAEVSLIIENEDRYLDIDFSEVKITRRIYKSGENEYFINNRKSRLKDINTLFMDTGIGKQAYSIIGQGRVERIISSNPKELKEIIEEAAGVKRAKTEKEESLKKLKEVKTEIEKIDYVEKELETRVKYLKEEGMKARLFKTYTEKIDVQRFMILEYNINEKSVLKKKYDIENKELKEKLNKILDEFDTKQEELQNSNINREKNYEKLEEEKIKNMNIFKVIENLKNEYSSLNSKYSNLETEEKEKEKRKVVLEKDILEKEEILNNSKSDLDIMIKDLEIKEKERNEIEIKVEKLKNKKNSILEDLKNKTQENQDLEVDKIKAFHENQDLEKRIVSAQSSNDRINKEKIEIQETFEKIIFRKDKIEKDKTLKEEEKIVKENELDEINKKLNILEKNREELNKEYNTFQYEYEQLNSKKRSIDNIINNNETFYKSIKYLLNEKINGIVGAFINLIDIPNGYEAAFQSLSGGYFQDIVVENTEVGQKCIEILREKKLGRASFLPIDGIKVSKINKEFPKEKGVIDFSRNIVKYNKKIEKVVEFVFGNSVIVENLEIGRKLLKSGFNDRIVTLEGDIITARGRITGGYVQKGKDELLERKKELGNIIEKIQIITQKQSILKEKRIELNAKIEKYEIKKIEKQNEIYIFNAEYKNFINEYDSFSSEFNKKKRQIDTLNYEINENEEFIISRRKTIEENKVKIKEIENIILKNNKKIEDFNIELSKIEDLSEFVSELNILDKEYEILKVKTDNNISRYNEINIDYEKLIKEKNEIIQFEIIRDELKESLKKEISSKRNEIEEKNTENNTLNNLIRNLELEIKNLEEIEKRLITEVKDIEVKMVNLQNEKEKILEKITKIDKDLEYYTIELEEINNKNIKESVEYKKIENEIEVNAIKRKLSMDEKSRLDIGAVNLASIEEYEKENERYNNLVDQKRDLIDSRESLLSLIKDIENEIVEKFSYAFEEINKNFEYMCKTILNDAKGMIKMNDSENLLDTGLELSVKYKNKPEQTLLLLSGGEKSMLAVSFIMAIFMFKPSPFTFFDEIEAALDEANTKKIVELLNNFIEKSQFILITHNKETMKGSHRLYGVTMNKEIGESRIISVDV